MGERGKHTPIPTPWRYQENSDAYTHIILGLAGEFICSTLQDSSGESEANARLIVHRVNTWEGLRDALEELARAYDRHTPHIMVGETWAGPLLKARAALRAAGRNL